MKADKPWSRLMREGAAASKQAVCTYYDYNEGDIRTCAIGAIALAKSGSRREVVVYEEADAIHGALTNVKVGGEQLLATPLYSYYSHRSVGLGAAIIDLNDRYGWSRERIAAWLESIGL